MAEAERYLLAGISGLKTSGATGVPPSMSGSTGIAGPMFEPGRTYKTVGGWDALIIWRREGVSQEVSPQPKRAPGSSPLYCVAPAYFAMHKPFEADEMGPVMHWADGRPCGSSFSVGEAPMYGLTHPATLTPGAVTKCDGKLSFLKKLFSK